MKMAMPDDGWGVLTPRRCQTECLPLIIDHFSKPDAERVCVRMIMGAGKSVTMAQVAACCKLEDNEVVVVSTSSINLVEQLSETFKARLETDFMDKDIVGSFYTSEKSIHTPIIICCMPSMQGLANILQKIGRKCALWMGDEFHKCEVKSIKEAYQTLMPERVLAFTATPFRTSEKQRLTMVDKLLYNYGPDEALRDKVVVPWRIVSWTEGESERDAACLKMTKDASGTGMFDADGISDAEVFAQKLRDASVKAEAIHSELPKDEHRKRMSALKSGELKCLVHVSQLVEGADIPSLSWLCLRRAVCSRVRFIQQVGRVLRAHPGKTEAVIFDPHGLFDLFRMSYSEILGGGTSDDFEEQDEGKVLEKQLEQSVFKVMRHIVAANAGKEPLSVSPLAGYLRELVNAFDVTGLIDRKIASRDWRSNPVSKTQASSINNMGWTTGRKCVPSIHKKALEILSGKADPQHKDKYTSVMNRGTASDLLSIMMSLADKKKWPDFKNLDNSAATALDKSIKKTGVQATQAQSQFRSQKAPEAPKGPPMVQGELF